MIGFSFLQYRVDAELGRGGMGIVYRATDTKLNRTVALKVLPAAALASEEDRARFFREAQAAAQLSHPNIATVYEIDEAVPVRDGSKPDPGTERRPFIAMEFIDGETLEKRIASGPLKLDEAVRIARQVAEALKAAHAKEIVHRDVKAANVMITADGVAKVLDFGLAKTQASTLLTRQGSTLGTIAYMSPEQARGQDVDGRSDLYSLGTVLYEMVAGRRPFAGDYEQAVVYGILNEDPEPLTAIRTAVPMGLEWIVNKLLAKERRHRYQTAADLIADLETVDLSGSGFTRTRVLTQPQPAPTAAGRSRPRNWIAAIGATAAVALLLGRMLAPSERHEAAPFTAAVVIPGDFVLNHPSISSDARFVAFTASGGRLMLYDFGDGSTRTILEGQDVRLNRFSPDGRWLAFEQGEDGVSIVQVPDGTVVRLTDRGRVPSWIDDEWLLMVVNGGLERMSRITQESIVIRTGEEPDSLVVEQPVALPGGKWVLVSFGKVRTGASDVGVIDVDDGSVRLLREDGFAPRYLDSGYLVYTADDGEAAYSGRVFAMPFDPGSARAAGPAVAVLAERGYWEFDVTRSGHLVTTAGLGEVQAEPRYRLVRVDPRTGEQTLVRAELPKKDGALAVSGDGAWFAFADAPGKVIRVGPVDPTRGGLLDIRTAVPPWSIYLSVDGETLYYPAELAGPGKSSIYAQATSGAAPAEELGFTDHDWEYLVSVAADGRSALVNGWDDGESWWQGDLDLVDMESRTGRTLNTPWMKSGIDFVELSPDGAWISFDTYDRASGSFVVGVDGTGPWQVAPGLGEPRWLPDSRALVVRNERELFVVPLSMDRGVRPLAPPRSVYSGAVSMTNRIDPTDGSILVMERERRYDAGDDRIDLVLNWGERLKRQAPRG